VANVKKEILKNTISDSNNLIASAFGDNEESFDKNNKIFYSNEIDETTPPQILFNIKFGSIKEDVASLIFETYLNYGSLIFKRIEKMISFVRCIEKDYNILESCCGLVFRSGSDFEDLITEEYEIYKSRVESNSNLRKKLNQDISKSQELLNLFNSNDPASASSKGKDLFTNKQIFNEEDAVKLIEFLFQCIKYSNLWVLIVLSSAYEIMNLWGWDSGCPDFKLSGDYLIEPNVRGRRSDCIRLNFLYARALQFNGRYDEAIIIYDKLLILFSLSNYTMYRKITIEKLKCLIQKGDYLLATDLLGLLKLKDFPDDSDNDLSEIKDNELLKILKLNKEIGLYILYVRAANKNLIKSGLGNFVQSRVLSLNKLGVLNAGKQYSCEIQTLGFDKDANAKERKRKKELRDTAIELEASRSVLKSLASNSIEKSTKLLEESFSVLINLNPDTVSIK
jgi:tetratricopeptide (TPR) repeat protein